MILLLAVSPIVPIALIGGLGGGAYAVWRFFFRDDSPMPTPDDDDDDQGKSEDEKKSGGGGTTDPLRCHRSGTRYDANRWSSPVHVAAGMIPLGYPVSPKLTTSGDKKQIKRFQTDGIALGLKGLKGASSKAINGKMNPCTLVALGEAEGLLKSGNWIPRKDSPNWVNEMRSKLAAAGWDV